MKKEFLSLLCSTAVLIVLPDMNIVESALSLVYFFCVSWSMITVIESKIAKRRRNNIKKTTHTEYVEYRVIDGKKTGRTIAL